MMCIPSACELMTLARRTSSRLLVVRTPFTGVMTMSILLISQTACVLASEPLRSLVLVLVEVISFSNSLSTSLAIRLARLVESPSTNRCASTSMKICGGGCESGVGFRVRRGAKALGGGVKGLTLRTLFALLRTFTRTLARSPGVVRPPRVPVQDSSCHAGRAMSVARRDIEYSFESVKLKMRWAGLG